MGFTIKTNLCTEILHNLKKSEKFQNGSDDFGNIIDNPSFHLQIHGISLVVFLYEKIKEHPMDLRRVH